MEGEMDPEELQPKPKVAHDIGCSLDSLSIDELQSRIELMNVEIKRLRASIEQKKKSRTDADDVFKI